MTNVSKKSTVRLLKDLKKRFQTKGWVKDEFGDIQGPCCLIGGVRALCGRDPGETQRETAGLRPAERLVKALHSAIPHDMKNDRDKPVFDSVASALADDLIRYNDDEAETVESIFYLIDRAIYNEQEIR